MFRLPALPWTCLAAALATAFALACSAPPLVQEARLEPTTAPPVEVRRHLAFDDVLRVEFYAHRELSTGELGRRIDYDGNIDLPLIGPVQVLGLTLTETRALLEERARNFVKRPSVAVSVVSYSPRLYTVLGEVTSTGAYELKRPITALEAVASAGGLTRYADKDEVVLLRVRDETLTVHNFSVLTPDTLGMVHVEPGDLIFVREDGSGTFQQQIMPYLQGLAPPFAVAASLFLLADGIND